VPGRKAWHSSGQCKSVPDRFVPRSTTAWMQEVGQCRSNCRGVRGDYSFPRSAWECRLNRSCGSGRSASLSRRPRRVWEPGESPSLPLFQRGSGFACLRQPHPHLLQHLASLYSWQIRAVSGGQLAFDPQRDLLCRCLCYVWGKKLKTCRNDEFFLNFAPLLITVHPKRKCSG
jgi:hypothetical protein